MLVCIVPFVSIVGPIFVPTIVEETVPNTAEHHSGIASLAAKVIEPAGPTDWTTGGLA
jgi:hypothetical protein